MAIWKRASAAAPTRLLRLLPPRCASVWFTRRRGGEGVRRRSRWFFGGVGVIASSIQKN